MITCKRSRSWPKFILFGFVLSFCTFSQNFAQTSIDFTPPDPFCSLDSMNCIGPISITFTVITDESDGLQVSYELQLHGESPTLDTYGVLTNSGLDYSVDGSYPIGDHSFRVTVEESDGSLTTEELSFSVVDCLAPEAICINGLAFEYLPVEPGTDIDGNGVEDETGIVFYAEDFIAVEPNDCSDSIRYSINISGEPVDPEQELIVYDCCMPETLVLQIWVWDDAFNPYAVQPDGTIGGPNADFCETYALIQDNMFNLCDCFPFENIIAGTIATEYSEGIGGVDVAISGDQPLTLFTETDGTYYVELQNGEDISITPHLDLNHLNGVSTFDLILMLKHILGVQHLDSPYKMIAADANGSGTITMLDMVTVQQLILGYTDMFFNNESWRFVDATYVFPNPQNPWEETFPEVIGLNNIEEDKYNLDFVGIKIGDLNGSAQTND